MSGTATTETPVVTFDGVEYWVDHLAGRTVVGGPSGTAKEFTLQVRPCHGSVPPT